MSSTYPGKEELAKLRKKYPTGTRIKLTEDMDDSQPIKKGEMGTVTNVDDIGTIHMRWDNGRGLGIVEGVDHFIRIKEDATESIKDATKKISHAKEEILLAQKEIFSVIRKELNDIPDLAGYDRISAKEGGPRCGSLSFSEIMKSPTFILSASHYDLQAQASEIIEKINSFEEKYEAEAYGKVETFISTLCEKKELKTNSETIKLHPNVLEVLERIKTLLDECK